MKLHFRIASAPVRIIVTGLILCLSGNVIAQDKIRFGIHADPVISWFSTNIDAVKNEGSRPGFNFGLNLYKYFGSNYAFSTGISLVSAGGKLVSDSTSSFDLTYRSKTPKLVTVNAGDVIVYKIQYVSVPIGLKLQTNQIGYITIFTDLGIDPKVVVSGKTDIPALELKGQNAGKEINLFNVSWHVIAGIEYGIGGNTAVVLGMGFENNFADITTDRGNQPRDRISHKLLSFRLGVNF